MASVDLTTEQVVEFIRQLPSERKRELLLTLATEAQNGRESRIAFAEEQFRRAAAERGLNWEAMSDEERQTLADNLIHEDRQCRP
jgi:hypothetical protein